MPPRKIYVDPGHGGADPGAVGHGIEEEDVALAVALRVADHLRRHGLEVRLSRTGDVGKSLQARTDEANAWGADAFVSVHCNAAASPEAEGFEVWHTVFVDKSKGDELARAIVRYLDQLTPLANRGARSKAGSSGRDYYHVIRETKMPAVIVECGFVSSARDAAYLRTPAGQAAIAEAIARGVVEWAGMAWRPAAAPAPKPAPKPAPAPKPEPKLGPFRDVPADDPDADTFQRLKAAGIIQGYSDGTVRPEEVITMRRLARLLDRVLQRQG